MIKGVTSFLFLLSFALNSMGQSKDSSYRWVGVAKYSISDEAVWSVDGLENVYISEYGLINKYDSTSKLKFTQSIKALGTMKQLVPVNTMKLVYFSEEQQTLCYFDNTLSSLDDCIDLSDQNIINAVLVSESNQPNKLWVLDNLNSRLLLLSLDNLFQLQTIVNLKGLLSIGEITDIKERGNRLMVLDKNSGVYILDYYGTLIDSYRTTDIRAIDANEQMLFILKEDKLEVRSLLSSDHWEFELPVNQVDEFAYRNRRFFFKSKNTVHKFRLQFSQ